jgi:hypothetical protein
VELLSRFRVAHPGQRVGVSLESLRALLPQTANIYAVDYRGGMLNMLHQVLSDYSEKFGQENAITRLIPFRLGEDFDDCVIRVMARIRMEWMQLGFAYSGWPYDIEEFVREVEQEAK